MTAAGQYICGITAGAMLCGIVCGLLRDSPVHSLAKLVCGVMMTVAFLRPLTQHFDWDISNIAIPELNAGKEFASHGEEITQNAMGEIISERIQAYILDIAVSIGAEISVEVELGNTSPPIPECVYITGELSPYQKLQLEEIIQEDLNIPRENQIWIG